MSHTRWLNETEAVAWRSFIESIGDLMSAFEAGLGEHGLTLGDYQVLVYLSEAPNRSMRMCDLADALRLSPSGLTRRLDGLVKGGLVSREPNDDDRARLIAEAERRLPRRLITKRQFEEIQRLSENEGPGGISGRRYRPSPDL